MMEFARPEHVVGVPWFQFLPPAVVPLAVAEWHARTHTAPVYARADPVRPPVERSFADAVKRSYVLEMQSVGHTQRHGSARSLCRFALSHAPVYSFAFITQHTQIHVAYLMVTHH